MIIETKSFQSICNKILPATIKSSLSTLTDNIELIMEGNKLSLNVSNGIYYASTTLDLDHEENFHATINAASFLKLVSQITTENIELIVKDTYLMLKGNGNYKLPLIFRNDAILTLNKINIDNVTSEFKIPGVILQDILTYNSKGIAKKSFGSEAQAKYYIDEKGCITFTEGACINNFNLEKPIKLLLDDYLVKLFKLFNEEDSIDFTLGYDPISDKIIQTKIRLSNGNTSLTSIISCDNSLLNSVPAQAIRDRALTNYTNSIVLSKEALLQALNRLSIFSPKGASYCRLVFEPDKLLISDYKQENMETLIYQQGSSVMESYNMDLDMEKLKITLLNYDEDYVTLNFGNHQALVVKRNNILNVLTECKLYED